LDIGVLGYIGIVQHKEHSPEVLSIPPGTPCIPRTLNLVIGMVTTGLESVKQQGCQEEYFVVMAVIVRYYRVTHANVH